MEIVMTAQGKSALQMRSSMTTMVVLSAGEVYCLPEDCDRFYVISGTAWLTSGEGDRILWSGESTALPVKAHSEIPAVVGGLGDTPLVLEFCGAAEGFGSAKVSPWQRWGRRLTTALGRS